MGPEDEGLDEGFEPAPYAFDGKVIVVQNGYPEGSGE